MNHAGVQLGVFGVQQDTSAVPSNELNYAEAYEHLYDLPFGSGGMINLDLPVAETHLYDVEFVSQNAEPKTNNNDSNTPDSNSAESSSPNSNNPKSGSFACPINCGYRAKTQRDVDRHKRGVHDKARNHSCPQAGCPRNRKGFARKDGLLRHVRTRHPGMGPGGRGNTPLPPLLTIQRAHPALLTGSSGTSTPDELVKLSKEELIMRLRSWERVAKLQEKERSVRLELQDELLRLESGANGFKHDN